MGFYKKILEKFDMYNVYCLYISCYLCFNVVRKCVDNESKYILIIKFF